MKYYIWIITVILVLNGCDNKDTLKSKNIDILVNNGFKKYEVKSARLEYSYFTNNKLDGKEKITFDNYGYNFLREIQSSSGKTDVKEYWNGGIYYYMDYNKNQTFRSSMNLVKRLKLLDKSFQLNELSFIKLSSAIGVYDKNIDDIFLNKVHKNNYIDKLDDNYAQKIGTAKVLGYMCDVWKVKYSKIYLYKNILLKEETSYYKSIVTKAEFDIEIDDNEFKLPSFPIVNYKNEELNQTRLDLLDIEDNKQFVNELLYQWNKKSELTFSDKHKEFFDDYFKYRENGKLN